MATFTMAQLLALAQIAVAADSVSGDEIARRRFEVNRGWENVTARLELELRQGKSNARREIDMRSLEYGKSGERNLLRVLSPGDLRGTVLLTHTHDERADEQWLYLPVLKRTRRIALESKGGAFLSSQLSFEDLTPFQPQNYTYRRLPDQPCGEVVCYVVESIPVAESSIYSRLINHVRQDDYRLVRTELHDRQGRHHKTMVVEDFIHYRERYWRPRRMVMTDHLADAETTAIWSEQRYDESVSARDFDASALRRIGF